MSKFEMHNAAKTIEAQERPRRGSGTKRPEEIRHLSKVIMSEPGVAEKTAFLREQIRKSESVKDAEKAITMATKFFEAHGGEQSEQDELLADLRAAHEALIDERVAELAKTGEDSEKILSRNTELRAKLSDLIEIASKPASISASVYRDSRDVKNIEEQLVSKQSNFKMLEKYQSKKQAEYKKAQGVTKQYAKQIEKAFGVDPATIPTMGRWERFKLSAKDLIYGGIVEKWREATEKEEALSSELQTYGKERLGQMFPSDEKVKRTQAARMPKQKRDVELGEIIGQQYPEQTGEIILPGAQETARKIEEEDEAERIENEKDKIRVAKIRKEVIRTEDRRLEAEKQRKEIEALETDLSAIHAKEDITPPAAIFEAGEKAKKVNKERQEGLSMNIEKASSILSNASAVWNLANEQLKTRRTAIAVLDMEDPYDRQNNAPTKYVFAVAKYKEALEGDDENRIAATKATFDKLNAALGLDERNPQLSTALAGREKPFVATTRRKESGQAKRNRNANARTRF